MALSLTNPVTLFREPTVSSTNFAGPRFSPKLICEGVTTRFVSLKLIFERLQFVPTMEVTIQSSFENAPTSLYCPNASHDVQQYVASCPTCQLMKSSSQRPAGLLQPLEPPTKPFTQVSMNFIT
ncbi:hypothetical protein CLOP_g3853 [Closterium sp. NIES-67]|nr:hypothetical protein CLOP_g24268 [Closterium sp. NIES-67]GJP73108.1 hypothetical protein CLOP_g3853 [Closterium sp. NIES-67]